MRKPFKAFISAANTPRLAAGTDRRWGFQRGVKNTPLVAVKRGFPAQGEPEIEKHLLFPGERPDRGRLGRGILE